MRAEHYWLLSEYFARFPGTAGRHWFLSDGGHFENLGAYELIRRRLPLIVVVDAAQDTDYAFEDLANLVRKARLDFAAEIRFLGKTDLEALVKKNVLSPLPKYLGELEELCHLNDQNGTPRFSRAYAALAEVCYLDSNMCTWLLYIKPALVGTEPTDVLHYHRSHEDFPQEPTADQFFDEAQWESYRKLGDYIARQLFANGWMFELARHAIPPWETREHQAPQDHSRHSSAPGCQRPRD